MNQETIEAGHRTIIRRAMRLAKVGDEYIRQCTPEMLNDWAYNNPVPVCKIVSQWLDSAENATFPGVIELRRAQAVSVLQIFSDRIEE